MKKFLNDEDSNVEYLPNDISVNLNEFYPAAFTTTELYAFHQIRRESHLYKRRLDVLPNLTSDSVTKCVEVIADALSIQVNELYVVYHPYHDLFIRYSDKLLIRLWEHPGTLEFYGAYETVEQTIKALFKAFGHLERKRKVRWAYQTPRGIAHRTFTLDRADEVHDEYYPYLTGGVNQFMKSYIDNRASVMILMGEPGTGKSTFIKSLIHKHKRHALITYDAEVMRADEFFADYLEDESLNLLVIEDADLLMLSRLKDSNSIMAKILNVSDGIINVADKKIILSTNLSKVEDFDEALIRPGRCHAIVNFRSLTKDEAIAAATRAGLGLELSRKEYTLAEIFNQKGNVTVPRFGFGRG